MGFVTENDLLFHTLYVIVTILSQTKSGYKAKRTSLRAVMYRFCTCEMQQVRLFACICQAKVDTKNGIILEAQFGLVLNWAFIAQSGRRPPVIEVIHILVQQLRNVLSSLQAEVQV